MLTLQELYDRVLQQAVQNSEEIVTDYDPHHLDCLLHPEKHAVVWTVGRCDCPDREHASCVESCLFGAIVPDEKGGVRIDATKCNGCAACVAACNRQNFVNSKDILPALHSIKEAKGPVYALIAPSFLGQFSHDVTPGKLRNAFKKIGFHGMLEVALFADILTLKEALEFDRNIVTEADYQLTSCCCPMWIALIRKIYNEMMPHIPGSVSPMIASGRAVKQMHPDAVTIFIGPCMAKKAEAREADLVGAVDYVLTFQEMADTFKFAGVDPAAQEDTEKDHSSRAGRIYAYAGGVSEAVKSTVERLNPHREITVQTRTADGIPACKEMMNELRNGVVTANFYEGMGCKGGCVGGPKVLIDAATAKEHVMSYGDEATYKTPADNPYVLALLERLGFDTVESLLHDSEIFTRHF